MGAESSGPVIVGVDGSANSQHALMAAHRHATRVGAPLVVVHAIGLTEEIGGAHVPARDHRDEIARRVDEWCAVIREGPRDDDDGFEVRLVDGSPVDALLRVARSDGASLIVVGRRGAGGRPELLLGSTAHQVVEHSRHPVLVIPPLAPER